MQKGVSSRSRSHNSTQFRVDLGWVLEKLLRVGVWQSERKKRWEKRRKKSKHENYKSRIKVFAISRVREISFHTQQQSSKDVFMKIFSLCKKRKTLRSHPCNIVCSLPFLLGNFHCGSFTFVELCCNWNNFVVPKRWKLQKKKNKKRMHEWARNFPFLLSLSALPHLFR